MSPSLKPARTAGLKAKKVRLARVFKVNKPTPFRQDATDSEAMPLVTTHLKRLHIIGLLT